MQRNKVRAWVRKAESNKGDFSTKDSYEMEWGVVQEDGQKGGLTARLGEPIKWSIMSKEE